MIVRRMIVQLKILRQGRGICERTKG
ncbi:Protein of unknown function [Thermobacillus xylanilyticus]|uniref:Uncharacterized protein n=1 Tax=Thermobacillus xylanilyticus TaxID=76633 RepID=A0ABN7S5V6_THEXY|nr:Protein of unknown function [Thermobacillus xylanilyticus]